MARNELDPQGGEAAAALRFLLVGVFVVLVGAQSLFVAWGLNAAAAASGATARPDRMLHFFTLMLMFLVPAAVVDAAVAVFLAEKIALPLERMRRAMAEAARGNLEAALESDPEDFLGAYTEECRKLVETLRRLLYRDRDHLDQANRKLTALREALGQAGLGKEEHTHLDSLIVEAKSLLSLADEHFLKGRKEHT